MGDRPATDEGVIMGTISYMSPEQAQGKQVDARSDIFSFGALLYEMLTGHRAFQGDTKMATLAAILKSEPEPLDQAAESIPHELARILQRCLRKDPDRRAHNMVDLRLALEQLKRGNRLRHDHRRPTSAATHPQTPVGRGADGPASPGRRFLAGARENGPSAAARGNAFHNRSRDAARTKFFPRWEPGGIQLGRRKAR